MSSDDTRVEGLRHKLSVCLSKTISISLVFRIVLTGRIPINRIQEKIITTTISFFSMDEEAIHTGLYDTSILQE